MIPRTGFHCITTWVARVYGFVFNSQMALLFNVNFFFDYKNRLYFIVPGMYEKVIFAQENFCLQGVLNDINEQDTSFA